MGGETILLRDRSGREHRASVTADDTVSIDGTALTVRPAVDGSLQVECRTPGVADGPPRHAVAWAVVSGETTWVFLNGDVLTFEREQARRRRGGAHHGSLTAPMPGTVRHVAVAAGDVVRPGDVLVVIEAMKMELPVRASADGIITAVNCCEGDLVQAGQALVEMG